MWQHTAEAFGGVLGLNLGRKGYGMELTGAFIKALDRTIEEATRISRVEKSRKCANL